MQLTATKRTQLGKQTKKLRKERKLPAVIFGKNMDSLPVTLDLNAFIKVFDEAGETNLIDVAVEGENYKVLVKGTQVHPVSSQFLHVDLNKVNLKEKVTASIPVEVVGEEDIDLVRLGEALVITLISEIEVDALPTELPDKFVVDVSGLTEIDSGVTIDELKYNKEAVEIMNVEPEELVVKLSHAGQEEEPEEELTEEELLEQLEATEETAEEATAEDSNAKDESASESKE